MAHVVRYSAIIDYDKRAWIVQIFADTRHLETRRFDSKDSAMVYLRESGYLQLGQSAYWIK